MTHAERDEPSADEREEIDLRRRLIAAGKQTVRSARHRANCHRCGAVLPDRKAGYGRVSVCPNCGRRA